MSPVWGASSRLHSFSTRRLAGTSYSIVRFFHSQTIWKSARTLFHWHSHSFTSKPQRNNIVVRNFYAFRAYIADVIILSTAHLREILFFFSLDKFVNNTLPDKDTTIPTHDKIVHYNDTLLHNERVYARTRVWENDVRKSPVHKNDNTIICDHRNENN